MRVEVLGVPAQYHAPNRTEDTTFSPSPEDGDVDGVLQASATKSFP
jgi:hypothetical protein